MRLRNLVCVAASAARPRAGKLTMRNGDEAAFPTVGCEGGAVVRAASLARAARIARLPYTLKGSTMKKAALGLAAASALVLCTAASAQGHFGASVGRTDLSSDCTGTTSCDKSGTGGKLFGGYSFLPNLAGELVYVNFGKAKAAANINGTSVNAEIKTSGFGAGVALMGDFAPGWNGVARLGVARMAADVSGSALGQSASDKENSTQAYFGVGVGYAVTKEVSIDLSADFSRSKYAGESSNVRMLGVGMTFKF